MKITIRPLRIEDAYTSVKWRNDPEVFKYTGNTYSQEITIESEIEWIRKVISKPNDYRCAILADDVYVGNIYLTDITNEKADYHIFIGEKDYWGKGVAREASQLILEYAFSHLQLKWVELRVKKQNNRAIALYIALGFKSFKDEGDWIRMAKNNKF